MGRFVAACLLLCAACPRPAGGPARVVKPPAEVVDPCAADLSGTYLYASDPTWQYDARDDGGTLELTVTRHFADAGASQSDAGAATLTLARPRDAGAFWGEVRGLGGLPSGNICPMSFAVRLTACTDAGLTLLAAADGVIGEGCQAPSRPRNPAMLEHRLTRTHPDAGARP